MSNSNTNQEKVSAKLVTGTDLRRMRIHANKTTVEMAVAAGIKTRKTYEKWEKGDSRPSTNQFTAMCLFCGQQPNRIIRQVINREKVTDEIAFEPVRLGA